MRLIPSLIALGFASASLALPAASDPSTEAASELVEARSQMTEEIAQSLWTWAEVGYQRRNPRSSCRTSWRWKALR